MRNEHRRLLGHVAALAAGVALALITTSHGAAAPDATNTTARQPAAESSASHRTAAPPRRVVIAPTALPARIASKMDALERGEDYARLRPYFPATERGAQLAAYATLYGDI